MIFWKTCLLVIPLYELFLHTPPFNDVLRRARYTSTFSMSTSIFPTVMMPSLEFLGPAMRRGIAPSGHSPSQTLPVFVPPSTTLSVFSVPISRPLPYPIAVFEDIQVRSSATIVAPVHPSFTIRACVITAVMPFVAGAWSMIYPRRDSIVPVLAHVFGRSAIKVYVYVDTSPRLLSLRILVYWAFFSACGACVKLRTHLRRGRKYSVAWVRRLDLTRYENLCNWAPYLFVLLAILGDRISNTDNILQTFPDYLGFLWDTQADDNIIVEAVTSLIQGDTGLKEDAINEPSDEVVKLPSTCARSKSSEAPTTLSQGNTGLKDDAPGKLSDDVDEHPSTCARPKPSEASTARAISRPHSNREIHRSLVRKTSKADVIRHIPAIDPMTAEIYDLGGPHAVNLADYYVCSVIGSGGCGTVYKAKHRTLDKVVAVKRIPADVFVYVGDDQCLLADVESCAMMRVQTSPWYPSILSFLQDQGEDVIVMPCYFSGDLFDLSEKYGGINRSLARFYTAQLMIAIHGLHKEGIIHRDIKPENIMFDGDRNLILTDFGCATLFDGPPGETKADKSLRRLRNDRLGDDFPMLWATEDNPHIVQDRTSVGTECYYAPEVACLEPYSYGVDYYSMGITLFQMLTGRLPYLYDEGDNPIELCLESHAKDFQSLHEKESTFLLEVLRHDQFSRPGLAAMKAYSIFADFNWTVMEARQAPVPPLVRRRRKV